MLEPGAWNLGPAVYSWSTADDVDEEGGESTLWNGDAKSIGGLHETFSDRDVQVGRRDFLVESQVGAHGTEHPLHPTAHSTRDPSSGVISRWRIEAAFAPPHLEITLGPLHSCRRTAPHRTALQPENCLAPS